ncbi:MAG: hypothetical protein HKM07_06255 [Chlamydiae bacterium]|nr:hypothetical protein [Chlamydiota bacterium]
MAAETHPPDQASIKKILLSHFEKEKVVLDRPFPEIQQTADIAWESKKIIFQILCKSRNVPKIQEMTSEFKRIGWGLVWILPDSILSKKVASPEEILLRKGPSYFIDQEGQIYDQFTLFHKGRRALTSPFFPVTLSSPVSLSLSFPREELSQILQNRLGSSLVYFRGDIVDRALNHPSFLTKMHLCEEEFLDKKPLPFLRKIERMHTIFLNKLLEKLSAGDFPL